MLYVIFSLGINLITHTGSGNLWHQICSWMTWILNLFWFLTPMSFLWREWVLWKSFCSLVKFLICVTFATITSVENNHLHFGNSCVILAAVEFVDLMGSFLWKLLKQSILKIFSYKSKSMQFLICCNILRGWMKMNVLFRVLVSYAFFFFLKYINAFFGVILLGLFPPFLCQWYYPWK